MSKFRARICEFLDRFDGEKKYSIPAKVVQTAAALFIILTSIVTYVYGVFFILPEMLSDSYFWRLLISLFGTWLLIGVLSNIYLIRKRDSSIRKRILLQPVVKPLPAEIPSMDSDVQLRETAKHLGQHFTPNPFGDPQNWHICASCEIFVPPRSWHCHICRTCILRRDHHCVFTGCCIGEENQSNFMGLLFYLGTGTTIVSGFCLVYALYFEEMSFLWYVFRTTFMAYTFFFEWDFRVILASICTIGQAPAWGVFLYYFNNALKARTSADAHRKIIRTLPGEKAVSLANMAKFLGPNPLMRIMWPFHQPFMSDYTPPTYKPAEDEPLPLNCGPKNPNVFKPPSDHDLGTLNQFQYHSQLIQDQDHHHPPVPENFTTLQDETKTEEKPASISFRKNYSHHYV